MNAGRSSKDLFDESASCGLLLLRQIGYIALMLLETAFCRLPRVLQRTLRTKHAVQLAYLFGSTVALLQGRSKKMPRDVDVAVWLTRMPSGIQLLRYRTKLTAVLESAVHALLGRAIAVDLILLNAADPMLRYQVIAHGIAILKRKPHHDRNFRVRVMTEYFDHLPLYDYCAKRLLSGTWGKVRGGKIRHG